MQDLEEIRSRFRNDRFAMEVTGITIDSAAPGKAICSLVLEERHMNANHVFHYLSCSRKGEASDRGGILSERRMYNCSLSIRRMCGMNWALMWPMQL